MTSLHLKVNNCHQTLACNISGFKLMSLTTCLLKKVKFIIIQFMTWSIFDDALRKCRKPRPLATEIITQLTLSKPSFNSQVSGMPITVGVGNVISEEGFSLLMSPAAAGSVWKSILSLGALPMGSNAWEKLRVLQGGDS
jgi:hypothetical protein